MATLKENINKAISVINSRRPVDGQKIGLDLLANVKDRIVQRGETATGEPFDGYSEAVVPYWFFSGRHRRGTSEAKLKKIGYFVSYKDFKRVNQGDKMADQYNAFLTGEMMRTMHVEVIEKKPTRTTVLFRSRTEAGRKKNKWQDERNDRLLFEPSKSELALAAKANEQRILGYLRQFKIIT